MPNVSYWRTEQPPGPLPSHCHMPPRVAIQHLRTRLERLLRDAGDLVHDLEQIEKEMHDVAAS